MIDPARLPTHLALVARRCHAVGPSASADTFLMTSYLVELSLKTIALTLASGVAKSSPSAAEKLEHELVHADGLGVWENAISRFAGQSMLGYLDSEMQPLISWLMKPRTKSDDEWTRTALSHCSRILDLLGTPDHEPPKKPTVRHLLNYLVRIRNKTKAHGAVGPDFFAQANEDFASAADLLLSHCPICEWEWLHLSVRPSNDSVKAIKLAGLSPTHLRADEAEEIRPRKDGLYFRLTEDGFRFHCGNLLRCNREFSEFMVPNGGYTSTGFAEFIDYATGRTLAVELQQYLNPPAPLPASATEGGAELDIFGNVFGNLPSEPQSYVSRPALEAELVERLSDGNHSIVTLHGRGGIGKTSLALHVAHGLSNESPSRFEHILWLSARDLELRPSGPSEVRRAISDLSSVANVISKLIDIPPTIDALAALLQSPNSATSRGVLLVFDNFETLDDPRELHKFLDTHTHIPNKVLITSRERAFKGDYPVEVEGMELEEATTLLRQESRMLGISAIVTDKAIEEIHEYTDGHAYVMRVLLGEIANHGQWVPLKSLVPRRSDLLNAVFERSFNRLSEEGKWVFLCVANWRSIVAELSLLVALGERELDAERGIEECVRLALLTRHQFADASFAYGAPELARIFARKKLEGDPDRLLIQEDMEVLRQFGTLQPNRISSTGLEDVTREYLRKCLDQVGQSDEPQRSRMDSTISRIAELWPPAWLHLARFRISSNDSAEHIAYALRRAVEETPSDKEVWLARANFAESTGDSATAVASYVSAVEADPHDVELIRETAWSLSQYIDAHKSEIPRARRGVYLASVREHMEKIAGRLDATGLSRLAWLFLLEGDLDGAWKYANLGLEKESTNSHCVRIVERVDAQGYVPSRP